jgi:hypothetical protein
MAALHRTVAHDKMQLSAARGALSSWRKHCKSQKKAGKMADAGYILDLAIASALEAA